jgi:hypothetical protein
LDEDRPNAKEVLEGKSSMECIDPVVKEQKN